MSTAISRRLASTVAAVAALSGAMLVTPTQAHAAWGEQLPFTEVANVSGGGLSFHVGEVHGWVQFDSGGHDLRYSLDVCRQDAYVLHVSAPGPDPVLIWNGATSPCWGGEAVVTGSLHAAGHISQAVFTLTGGTFVNGQNLVTDSDYYALTNPY